MEMDLIFKRLQIIEDLTNEMTILKENYDEALDNDPEYQVLQDEVAKFKDEFKGKKAAITSKDSYLNLANSIKEKKTEIRENKEALSQDLVDYYKESGELEIEDHTGRTKRMIFSVKLVSQ